jgi:transcriptional regulator with XRE-family HTH domain
VSTRDHLAGSRRIVQRETARLSRLDAIRTGEELRELRLGLGVPQAEVARVVGVSRSVISELEAGDPTVGLEVRRRVAVAVGADLRINVYPGATPLVHDAAHARLVERLLGRRHRCWQARIEARVPGPGRSSTDVRLEAFGAVVAIEVETHIRAWDAVVRRCQDKRERIRDALGGRALVHAVLLLPPTRHHRQLIAALGETVRSTFPVPAERLRRALEDGTPWPGDGILWMAGGTEPDGARAPRGVTGLHAATGSRAEVGGAASSRAAPGSRAEVGGATGVAPGTAGLAAGSRAEVGGTTGVAPQHGPPRRRCRP